MAISIPSSVAAPALLRLLADGGLHSGEWLAEQLGVSRAAVWKAVERLRQKGIDVQALHRRGYALPAPVEWLDETRIRESVNAAHVERIESLSLTFEVDSTNTRLLAAVLKVQSMWALAAALP